MLQHNASVSPQPERRAGRFLFAVIGTLTTHRDVVEGTLHLKSAMLSRLRLGWLRCWGGVANLAGFPGFVREGAYLSQRGVSVRVRTSPLYTTVTVNGMDVYFYRLTGAIDGVGFSPLSDCTRDSVPQSADSVLPAGPRGLPPTRT